MRIHKGTGGQYSALPNKVLRNEALSFRAIGLLAVLTSHRDGYQVTFDDLWGRGGREGRVATRTAWRELREAGHIWQTNENVDGSVHRVTHVSQLPIPGHEPVSDQSQEPETNHSEDLPLISLREEKSERSVSKETPMLTHCSDKNTHRNRSQPKPPRHLPRVDQGLDLDDVIASGSQVIASAASDPAERFNAVSLEMYFRQKHANVKCLETSNKAALVSAFSRWHKSQGLGMKDIRSLIDICAAEIPNAPDIPPWRYLLAHAQEYLARASRPDVTNTDEDYWYGSIPH